MTHENHPNGDVKTAQLLTTKSNSEYSDYTSSVLPSHITNNSVDETNKFNTPTTIRTRYKCKACRLIFTKRANYKRHTVKCQGTYHYCNNCNYKTVFKNVLAKHCKNKSCLTCDQCLSTFKTSLKLKQHAELHKKDYTCTNCPFVTKDICDFEQHLRMHAVQEPYMCEVCAFKTPWMRDLELHVAMHERNAFHCNKCTFKAYEKDVLTLHMSSSHIECFQCNFCPYQSISDKLFNIHMKRHTHERLYKCDGCVLQFVWKSSCDKHMEQHVLTAGQ